MGQGEKQQKAVEESVANFLVLEEALRTSSCFSGKAYFGGDKIGFIDITLGGMFPFIKTLEKVTDTIFIDPEKMPLLTAWISLPITAETEECNYREGKVEDCDSQGNHKESEHIIVGRGNQARWTANRRRSFKRRWTKLWWGELVS
jgi:hypothetical protein